VTVPHAQSTIALYTELHVEWDQQSAIVVDCRPHLPRLPSSPSAVNNCPTAVAVYIALTDSRRAVAKFLSVEFGTKFETEVYTFIFRDTLISLKCSVT